MPKPSSKSVPASVGSLALTMLISHLLGDAGPLETVAWQPGAAIWGRPAGLEGSPDLSLWPPCPGLQDPKACVCEHEKDRTPSVSSIHAPQNGPLTSWERTSAVTLVLLIIIFCQVQAQHCLLDMCNLTEPTTQFCKPRISKGETEALRGNEPCAQGSRTAEWPN